MWVCEVVVLGESSDMLGPDVGGVIGTRSKSYTHCLGFLRELALQFVHTGYASAQSERTPTLFSSHLILRFLHAPHPKTDLDFFDADAAPAVGAMARFTAGAGMLVAASPRLWSAKHGPRSERRSALAPRARTHAHGSIPLYPLQTGALSLSHRFAARTTASHSAYAEGWACPHVHVEAPAELPEPLAAPEAREGPAAAGPTAGEDEGPAAEDAPSADGGMVICSDPSGV